MADLATTEDIDAQVDEARAIISDHNRASTSFIQRQLGIGYNRAAAIMERLEDAGFVSKPNHAGKREVLGDHKISLQVPGREPVHFTSSQLHRAAEMFGDQDFGTKPPFDPNRLSDAAREKLRLTVERIERLNDEKAEIAAQIKDVYAEAKAMGYCTKTLRSVVKLRKQDRDERQEAESMLETYMISLGEI